MKYSERVRDALDLAFTLHSGQTRKGSGTPYIVHLLGVAAQVGVHGGNEDQFIAALLHDAVEDQGGLPTLERIRGQFGDRVADLVLKCSDSTDAPKPPWRARKEAYLARLAGEPPELKIIVVADKLDNARSIVRDMRQCGAAVWDRFTGKREGSLWYYQAIPAALESGWEHPLLDELRAAIAEMIHSDAAASPGSG